MLRHLKNFNELVLYASISCGLSFFARLNPSFFMAILLLRLCILAYAFYIIGTIEDNKIFGYCLGASVLVGLIGGYYDLMELHIKYNQSQIINILMIVLFIPLIFMFLYQQYRGK